MADNVAITAGSGTTIHADEYTHPTYGAGKSQIVKLALGAPGTGVDAVGGAGAVDGGTARVTLASDDPAGTKLTAGAASFVKLEDAAFAGGDAGAAMMAVRSATPVNNSGTDQDYEPLQISIGHLWVAPPPTDKMTAVANSFTAAGNGTAYISGEWISDNATAGSVTKLQWTPTRGRGVIRRVRIRKSDQSVATPTIRLYLWDATFTVAVGDNAAGAQPLQDAIGFVDVAVTSAGSDDAVGWTNIDIPYEAASIFGLIQSQSSFTGGTSEVWTIDLWELPG